MLPGLGSAGHDIPVTIKYVIAKGPVDSLFNSSCYQTVIINVIGFQYFS